MDFTFQREFPVADARYKNYFENSLTSIHARINHMTETDLPESLSAVNTVSAQLKRYIERLEIYNILEAVEPSLESNPISYSLREFRNNLELLTNITACLKKRNTDGANFLLKKANSLAVKEFDPG